MESSNTPGICKKNFSTTEKTLGITCCLLLWRWFRDANFIECIMNKECYKFWKIICKHLLTNLLCPYCPWLVAHLLPKSDKNTATISGYWSHCKFVASAGRGHSKKANFEEGRFEDCTNQRMEPFPDLLNLLNRWKRDSEIIIPSLYY